ncbi:MAG: cell division protein FtsL [Actinomycetia bacterium]|nr:cell division protein FtsL [Actinomycetes bacterium]
MAVAARKLDHGQTVSGRQTLRLVTAPPSRGVRTVSPTRRRSRHAQAPVVFGVFCAVAVFLAAVGLLRVTLAVRAAEDAIDAVELERSIKAEQLASKSLEADCSTLAAPSRIKAIAGSTLKMTGPGEVRYITLAEQSTPAMASEESSRTGVLASALDTVMDLAAGEAQMLLVGDMGLSASR